MKTILKYILSKAIQKLNPSAIKCSKIDASSKIEGGSNVAFTTMGKYSFCGYGCEITHAKIGAFTSIASNVMIGGARHPMEWVGMSPVFYSGRDSVEKKFSTFALPKSKPIKIGNDVWIGHSAIVLPGVTVGNGAVIGAGAVVSKDIPAYAVAVGNPAKIIKYRFDSETIKGLEALEWWDLPDKELRLLAKFIRCPLDFIQQSNHFTSKNTPAPSPKN